MHKNYTNLETQALKEAFEKSSLLTEYLDFDAYVDEDDTPEQAIDALSEAIHDKSIIYDTYEAIKYLTENDPSLEKSLELFLNQGYQVKDLDSTKLATLLLRDKLRDKFIRLY